MTLPALPPVPCAHCGRPVHALNSYGISTPVDEERIRPGDFCGLDCIAAWVEDVAALATGTRRRN